MDSHNEAPVRGGAEKRHAIRTHRVTWPMRAEISDTQGTHSLGHNIKLRTKGVKHGPERARGGKVEGGNRYVILRAMYSR